MLYSFYQIIITIKYGSYKSFHLLTQTTKGCTMIKLAIIGTNWITEKFIDAAIQTNKYQLVAIYSRDVNKAKIFAEKYHARHFFDNLLRLANQPNIDVVYIASPNSLHFSQAKLMLEHNKDVICEKPLTSNYQQTKALIDIAEHNQRIIFEALKTYYLPNYQLIKSYLPKLGKIRKVLLNYCQYSSRYDSYLNGNNPNTFNPIFSNGSLMDIGIYPLSFGLSLWGQPQQFYATSSLLASGVDAHGSVLCNYNDFDMIIWHSKVTNSYISSEIQGENGALVIDHLSTCHQVTFHPHQGEEKIISITQQSNELYYEALEFAKLYKQRTIDHQGIGLSLLASSMLNKIRKQIGVKYPADNFEIKE